MIVVQTVVLLDSSVPQSLKLLQCLLNASFFFAKSLEENTVAYVDKERHLSVDNWVVAKLLYIFPSHAIHHVEEKHFQEHTDEVEDQFNHSQSY